MCVLDAGSTLEGCGDGAVLLACEHRFYFGGGGGGSNPSSLKKDPRC